MVHRKRTPRSAATDEAGHLSARGARRPRGEARGETESDAPGERPPGRKGTGDGETAAPSPAADPRNGNLTLASFFFFLRSSTSLSHGRDTFTRCMAYLDRSGRMSTELAQPNRKGGEDFAREVWTMTGRGKLIGHAHEWHHLSHLGWTCPSPQPTNLCRQLALLMSFFFFQLRKDNNLY